MSVLETPRIYFAGQVAWDPITTNNYSTRYDETDAETIPPPPLQVQQYRDDAIAAVATGNWNPHGTHRSTFFGAAVSGADCGAGLVQNDPFVGSPANFMGMLVDLEPYGAFSSQLFFDRIVFGIDGGYRIVAPRGTRFTDRYINFNRNSAGPIAGIASVVWQTSFAKADGLRIDAFDSATLQALQQALQADDVLGITVQFNTYRTVYYDTLFATNQALGKSGLPQQLIAKLKGGGWQPNPARSMMVGVIGLWRRGEPACEPGDRVLVTGPDDSQNAPTVSSIHARLTGNSIALDLSNSISEIDLNLTKNNFGDLSVVAIDSSTGNASTLCTFGYSQYDANAYVATSGIVTLALTAQGAALAATSALQLRNASGQVLLVESQYRAVPLVPNLYINQGETRVAWFQVYDRGVPAGANVPVTVCVMSADGGTVSSSFDVVTAADGTISFPIGGVNPGISAFVPVPGPNPTLPTQGIDPQTYTYMYLRVLPADDAVAQLPPTWDNVFGRVLSNWKAMAPCMDNWLDLASEAQVRAYAPLLFRLTDPAAFEDFLYMPVTRDMTPGERTLLYNFLHGEPTAAAAAAMKAVPEKPVRFVELSKKMRS